VEEVSECNRGEVRIHLVPYPNEKEKNFSSADIKIKYRKNYPAKVPIISLEECTGLSEKDKRTLKSFICCEEKSFAGSESPILFELCDLISDKLRILNQPPSKEPKYSVYELMERQQKQKSNILIISYSDFVLFIL
jgi:hypothetical protein